MSMVEYRYLAAAPSIFFFFKQKTAYEMLRSLVGSEMCIRDRVSTQSTWGQQNYIKKIFAIIMKGTITALLVLTVLSVASAGPCLNALQNVVGTVDSARRSWNNPQVAIGVLRTLPYKIQFAQRACMNLQRPNLELVNEEDVETELARVITQECVNQLAKALNRMKAIIRVENDPSTVIPALRRLQQDVEATLPLCPQ
eukprot:TRINITY_DN24_c0_g1_i1.p1 TRINITY_DN24_c0_g1~~TRINITY_DN24_c0_g1_i1.p1  ORF type:complete len:198 (+),score=66.50 TRINITY_DN24_c0_g1_i1:2-595(+)